MKTFLKWLKFLGLTFLVTLILAMAAVYFFRDALLRQFIQAVNQHLNTPVTYQSFEISPFRDFPRISLVFREVYMEDSAPGKAPLLTAEEISFALDPWEMLNKQYQIRGLTVRGAQANIKVFPKGSNFEVLRQVEGSAETAPLNVELEDIRLLEVTVQLHHAPAELQLQGHTNNLTASLRQKDGILYLQTRGDYTSDTLVIRDFSLLAHKAIDVDSRLRIEADNNVLLEKTSLALEGAQFDVQGSVGKQIKLAVVGAKTDIRTLIALLPARMSEPLREYQSEGKVYFSLEVKGKTEAPALTAAFGCEGARVFHPGLNTSLEEVNLTGSFATPSLLDPDQGILVLKDFHGRLQGQPFTGNLTIRDLNDPLVQGDLQGKLALASLVNFLPESGISEASGSVQADLQFDGRLSALRRKSTARQFNTSGSIELESLQLNYNGIPLRDLQGVLQFNNNDLALSEVSGTLGNSDFTLNGFFRNAITYLLFDDQPIGIEADLQSNFLALDELLTIGYGNRKSEPEQFRFYIPENLYINFNCNLNRIRYDRFTARKVSGDLLVNRSVAISKRLQLETMGGKMDLSAIIDATNQQIETTTLGNFSGIHPDSLFLVFHNFDQDFITDKHLRGRVDAELSMSLNLSDKLEMLPKSLVADVAMTIRQGELNNFGPLQQLKKYMGEAGLDRLRFAELRNEIHIENETIYIPSMEIRSNITNLTLSGTHTFDQHIDYRIMAPLRRKLSDPEASAAMEEDNRGGLNLFLRIKGTTSDFKISYDTESVRKKIAQDLRKEVQELKDALKNKGQKKKVAELEENEYFDF